MPTFQDITGQPFGSWTVIELAVKASRLTGKKTAWLCRCVCGTQRAVSAQSLVGGKSVSCGCGKAKSFDRDTNTITCTKCKRAFPATAEHFHRHSEYKTTGFVPTCKGCRLPASRPCSKAFRARLREQVLRAYGGDNPACACRGEAAREFLAIDHANGDGAAHRRTVPGSKLYQWLRDNDFPHGFRILCHNCNFARGRYGYCPHERS